MKKVWKRSSKGSLAPLGGGEGDNPKRPRIPGSWIQLGATSWYLSP